MSTTTYFTIREYNQLTNFGTKVNSTKNFNYILRQREHRIVNFLNVFFKLAIKNKRIYQTEVVKDIREMYNYHRRERNIRATTRRKNNYG